MDSDSPTIPDTSEILIPQLAGINEIPNIQPVDIQRLSLTDRVSRIEHNLSITN